MTQQTIELNGFTASRLGFVINGAAAGDHSGWSVSGAGDVNGDGYDDFIIGSPYANSYTLGAGQSHVVFGKNDNSTIELKSLGAGGFIINGAAAYVNSGWSVSGAGDVNGDGKDDLIIGAPYLNSYIDLNGKESGKSYIVFGKSDNSAIELRDLGAGGFIINGIASGDRSGYSVSGAGDVNGDGKADLIIGSPNANPNTVGSGQSYVVFGKSDNCTIELKTLGISGFMINGIEAYDGSGYSVSGAGDVNADGKADLIIGAPYPYPPNLKAPRLGQSYVVFGKSDNSTIELKVLDKGGFIINGAEDFGSSGYSVSGAGDVNGDGKADLIIGAPYANPNILGSGQSYVVYGKSDNSTIELKVLGKGGFIINGAEDFGSSGYSVSGAGDVNGDGKADLVIGAPFTSSNGERSGHIYVVYGKSDTRIVELKALGAGGFVINGAAEDDNSGYSVSGAGDVNRDGKADLIIGAPNAGPNGKESGQSYVIFGGLEEAGKAPSNIISRQASIIGSPTLYKPTKAPMQTKSPPVLSTTPGDSKPNSNQSLSTGTLALLISAPIGGLLILFLALGLYCYKRRTTKNCFKFFRQAKVEQITEIEMETQSSNNYIREADDCSIKQGGIKYEVQHDEKIVVK